MKRESLKAKCCIENLYICLPVILINRVCFPSVCFPAARGFSSEYSFYQRDKNRAWKYILSNLKDDQIIRQLAKAKIYNEKKVCIWVYIVGYL